NLVCPNVQILHVLSFFFFKVIKYKLCRCRKKNHKRSNNNDRGAVLSLDNVQCHVSN
ncbi:acid-sensing ion channel 1B isoform X1, partial [Tachysurus ichikawai]